MTCGTGRPTRDVAGLLAVVAQRVEPAGRGPWMRATDAVLREAKDAAKGAGTVAPAHAGLAAVRS